MTPPTPGSPIQKSRPSGSAISSRKYVPRLRAGDAAHDLADEVAVGHRVVAVRGARAPRAAPACSSAWIIGSHASASLERQLAVDPREPGLVRAAGTRPGWSPCRPAANSGQYSATGASMSSSPSCASRLAQIGGRALGRREDELHRVLGPRAARRLVGDATPEVDDLLALVVRGERRADLEAVLEVPLELLADPLEPSRGVPVDRHAFPLSRPRLRRSIVVVPDNRRGREPSIASPR